MPPVLEAKSLSYGNSPQEILQENLSFSLEKGQLLWVQGKNGSGKSTLLRLILGEIKPQSGELAVHATTQTYLPQLENIALHMPATLGDVYWLFSQEGPSEDALLKGLPPHWQQLSWSTASGGERKRCLLAGMLKDPGSLLLLDEPFNHLDTGSRADLSQRLQEQLRAGRSIVLVSHAENDSTLSPAQTLKLREPADA